MSRNARNDENGKHCQPSGDFLLFVPNLQILPFSPNSPLFKGPLLPSNLNRQPFAIFAIFAIRICHFCQNRQFRRNRPFHPNRCSPRGLACVASVSVRFRSKERGMRVKARHKNGASNCPETKRKRLPYTLQGATFGIQFELSAFWRFFAIFFAIAFISGHKWQHSTRPVSSSDPNHLVTEGTEYGYHHIAPDLLSHPWS